MNLYHFVRDAVHSSAPYKLRKLYLNGHKGDLFPFVESQRPTSVATVIALSPQQLFHY